MAYPPPVLPVNQTNATPQADVHPLDHQRANQAINDIVAHLANIGQVLSGTVTGGNVATDTEATAASIVLPAGCWIVHYDVMVIGAGPFTLTVKRFGTAAGLRTQKFQAVSSPGFFGVSLHVEDLARGPITFSAVLGQTGTPTVSSYADPSNQQIWAVGTQAF